MQMELANGMARRYGQFGSRPRQAVRRALMISVATIGIAAPALGYAQDAITRDPAQDRLTTVIEVAQLTAIGTLLVIGYVYYGIPGPDEAGYLMVGIAAGYLGSDWVHGRWTKAQR